jgi:hypothetical protein
VGPRAGEGGTRAGVAAAFGGGAGERSWPREELTSGRDRGEDGWARGLACGRSAEGWGRRPAGASPSGAQMPGGTLE